MVRAAPAVQGSKIIWGEIGSTFYIFLYISDGKFVNYSCCGTGKQNIFCSPENGALPLNRPWHKREVVWDKNALAFCNIPHRWEVLHGANAFYLKEHVDMVLENDVNKTI